MAEETTPPSSPAAPAAPSSGSSSGPSRPSYARPGGRPGASGGTARARAGGRKPWGPYRRKVCRFCAEKIYEIDYKNVTLLRSFITEGGKILAGRSTGTCASCQRKLTLAIKRARNIALLPYSVI